MATPFPNIRARGPVGLRGEISRNWKRFVAANHTPTEFNERYSMWEFLRVCAKDAILNYPIEVTHSSELVPDFSLQTPSETIGVECSVVTNGDYEAFKKLPQHAGSFSPTPYLTDTAGKGKADLKEAALNFGSGEPWPLESDLNAFLFKQTQDRMKAKAGKLRKPNYRAHSRQWLLLWDCLSLFPAAFRRNAQVVQEAWDQYWRNCCGFDLVIIGREDLREFALITPAMVRLIEREKAPVPRALKGIIDFLKVSSESGSCHCSY